MDTWTLLRAGRRLVASIVLVSLWGASAAHAQGRRIPDDVRTTARALVDNRVTVGIVVGIVDGSGARYFSYGATSGSGGQPVSENTIFEIGSVTKVFTALALAGMVAKGEVGLDDPVQRYLPDSIRLPKRDTFQITLRLLSAQRSGLPRLPSNMAPADPTNPYADYDDRRLYAFLTGHTLTRDPGAQYEYSNLGVGLLGFALARRAGTSYEDLIVQRIAAPLGLTNTRVTLTPDLRARLARGHQGEREVSNWDLDALAGAGAIRSNAADLAKFLAAAMGLSKTPLDSAVRLTQVIQGDAGPAMRIGLGWHVMWPDSAPAWWHNGGTGGYHSFIGFDPRHQFGVVVLSNSTHSIDDIGFHLLNPSFPLAAVRRAVALPVETLDEYVAEYQLAPGFAIAIRKEGDALVAQATGQGAAPIFASSRDEFFYRVVDAQISFVRDSTGKVVSLVLHQGGRNLPAPRMP